MYKVQYKSHNAFQAWMNHGTYGNESLALSAADRISGRYFMVRVVDKRGAVVWTP